MLGVCTVSIIDSKGGHKFPCVQRAPDTTLANIEGLLSFAFEQRKDFFSAYSSREGSFLFKNLTANSPQVASASHSYLCKHNQEESQHHGTLDKPRDTC